MIVTEKITINDREFIRTYSNSGCYVVRDGVSYSEAIDPIGFDRVYTETSKPIGVEEEVTDYD